MIKQELNILANIVCLVDLKRVMVIFLAIVSVSAGYDRFEF